MNRRLVNLQVVGVTFLYISVLKIGLVAFGCETQHHVPLSNGQSLNWASTATSSIATIRNVIFL